MGASPIAPHSLFARILGFCSLISTKFCPSSFAFYHPPPPFSNPLFYPLLPFKRPQFQFPILKLYIQPIPPLTTSSIFFTLLPHITSRLSPPSYPPITLWSGRSPFWEKNPIYCKNARKLLEMCYEGQIWLFSILFTSVDSYKRIGRSVCMPSLSDQNWWEYEKKA